MARLFGCPINVESEGGDGGENSIAGEVSRSGIQPEGGAMSSSVRLPPLAEREENNPCLSVIETRPDSGSALMLSESDLHNCFIDFLGREPYEAHEFHTAGPIQSPSPCLYDLLGNDDMEEERIELGLGIGSGSESGSGDDLFGEAILVDEQLEWEDSLNAITWVSDPVQATSLFSLEEEEEEEPSLANMDLGEQEINNMASRSEAWEVLSPMNDFGYFGGPDIMDLDDFFLSTMYELSETHEDYETFHQDLRIMPIPPASRTVVDALPLVQFTSQELSSGNIVCAICTDDILVHEKVNRLPCNHYYHGQCIVPWLRIKNTCPVCRYELPTDHPDYERNRRSQNQGT